MNPHSTGITREPYIAALFRIFSLLCSTVVDGIYGIYLQFIENTLKLKMTNYKKEMELFIISSDILETSDKEIVPTRAGTTTFSYPQAKFHPKYILRNLEITTIKLFSG